MMWLWVILSSAALGSFANVIIYRLPLMILTDDGESKVNLALPASHCPNCLNPLKWWHNMPLLSFILLGRRCAICHASIAWRYFVVECGTVVLAVLCFLQWGWTLSALAYFVFLYFLWTLAWIDALSFLLPDALTLLLLWLGLLYQAMFVPTRLTDAVFAAAFGYALLYVVYTLHHTLTGRQGLGFGDMKLLAAIGAWLGVAAIANVLIVACALAFGYVIFLKIKIKQLHGRMVPFGPFLAAAATLVLVTEFDFGRWLVGYL